MHNGRFRYIVLCVVYYYVIYIYLCIYVCVYIPIHASRDNSQTLQRCCYDGALPFFFFISFHLFINFFNVYCSRWKKKHTTEITPLHRAAIYTRFFCPESSGRSQWPNTHADMDRYGLSIRERVFGPHHTTGNIWLRVCVHVPTRKEVDNWQCSGDGRI